jgi:GDP-D-mannose dehydratase
MQKIALSTGVAVQDGVYLTKLLLGKGYDWAPCRIRCFLSRRRANGMRPRSPNPLANAL